MSTLPDQNPTIRVTAMPSDANPYGDIFGGWLMGIATVATAAAAPHHQISVRASG
jgi:acyl-CoA thioesterase YciA